MSYEVKYTSRFKRQYQDHPLHGDYEGHRDCHIEPDWVLIYFKTESNLVLTLSRTGSHGDVF